MDQRTIACLDGQTAILTEILQLLVRKGVLSPEEISDVVTTILRRGIECGAQPGFDAVPMHVLRLVGRRNRHRSTSKSCQRRN